MNSKKLYFLFRDNGDNDGIVMCLDGIFAWIGADVHGLTEQETEGMEWSIEPVWMTEEEYENLPEADL